MARIKVTLVKSGIGSGKKQKSTLVGLGLRKINASRTLENTGCVRGMIRKVQHLVQVESVE